MAIDDVVGFDFTSESRFESGFESGSCSDIDYSDYDPIEMSIVGIRDKNSCMSYFATHFHMKNDRFEEAYATAVRTELYGLARDVVDYIAKINPSDALYIVENFDDKDLLRKKDYILLKEDLLENLSRLI